MTFPGFNRRAWGGTHLRLMVWPGPMRIVEIDNRDRHDRRMHIGLEAV